MPVYIDKQKNRPDLFWEDSRLLRPLAAVRYDQGHLIGRMGSIPFRLRQEAALEALTLEVIRSAALEGVALSAAQVRTALGGRLGCDAVPSFPVGIDASAAVAMIWDVLHRYDEPLTEKRLAEWHTAITPVRRKRAHHLVHYQRPDAHAAPARLRAFLDWFNTAGDIDPVIKAGVAGWWFLMVHPFDEGNARIARAITDMQLARADGSGHRYYSLSDRISRQRDTYEGFVAATQRSDPDITAYLEWFLHCLRDAMTATDGHLSTVLKKAIFWEKHADLLLNERQRSILGHLLDGLDGKLTSSYWARLSGASSDTAVRDINELVRYGILKKNPGGGRSTSYVLVEG